MMGPEGTRGPAVAAGYIRVSSKSQDYAYQRVEIERAAKARGEVVHLWYGDVATGRTMDRPQLIKLREAVRAGKVSRLWVWRIDRLSRGGIVDTLSAIGEIQRCGCSVESVADGFALNGPASEMVLAALAWAAQLEREKIRENQAAARARMAAEGRYWGHPPIGAYTRAQVIELGRQQKSIRQIAREIGISKSCAWKILKNASGSEKRSTGHSPDAWPSTKQALP